MLGLAIGLLCEQFNIKNTDRQQFLANLLDFWRLQQSVFHDNNSMHRFLYNSYTGSVAFSLPDAEIVIQHIDNLLSFIIFLAFIIFLVFLPHGMYNQYHLVIQFAWGEYHFH